LWLNVPVLLEGYLNRVLSVLQEGLERTKHTAFVERLLERRG